MLCVYMHEGSIKMKARRLRAAGRSLKAIAAKLNIAKSTASLWLRDMPLGLVGGNGGDPDLGNKSHQRAVLRLKLWRQEASQLWTIYSKQPFFFMGLGLYWGEGAKTKALSISNSDPDLLRCWVAWCRKYLPEGLRQIVRVIAHADVDQQRARRFWSRVTGYPVAAHVTRINTRKKDRSPTRIAIHGTARVLVGVGAAEWFVKVMFWIGQLKRTCCSGRMRAFQALR